MIVKMKTGLSGPKLSLSPGDEHEFEEAEAQRLIDAGFAAAVPDPDAVTPKGSDKA